MSNYETAVAAVKRLTPEERRRLRELLAAEDRSASSRGADDRQARIEAWFAAADALAARVGAAWKDDMTAVEAVREQRREL